MASQSRLLRLPVLLALLLGIALLFLSPLVLADSQDALDKDSTKPDLICHTSDPADCYPRIFVPTDEFQTVHDDQEIPKGLHVQLNINTGEKLAKIYVPDEPVDPALEGLPVEREVIKVEPEARDDPIVAPPKGAPAYEAAGKIKAPPHENAGFVNAVRLLKADKGEDDPAFDASLDAMEELAHDLHYGLQVASDPEIIKSLVCHMIQEPHPGTAAAVEGLPPRDQQAATILAASLRNNPTALAEVSKHWPEILKHKCPGAKAPLGSELWRCVGPRDDDTAPAPASASSIKARVAAVDTLIKDHKIRDDFVRAGLMNTLTRVLAREGPEWAAAQRKAGVLALNNFLDEDVGAITGQWPKGPRLTDEKCAEAGTRAPEGCWDYHVDRIVKANKADKSHWSKDVQARLAAARKANPNVPQHVEL
ncbi:hypothetical protein ISF_04311 [Cordyceps fumosorosea ARSEF 2679]|uniref:Nucleotide exchange factor SIL1 n=1 Tax=Cordyceps fumosorosea (strain ARSEF 2679) TaxID=1081104 RepID=A0A167XF16_CORFA|nr:hypothetical protein ISF_04311 [Cordyceps fumosorosea ARSEF 2679]OAA64901.1 hypothetical protein ISF_04311 [Cordyceps fumosorosea ARSEF 2679]